MNHGGRDIKGQLQCVQQVIVDVCLSVLIRYRYRYFTEQSSHKKWFVCLLEKIVLN